MINLSFLGGGKGVEKNGTYEVSFYSETVPLDIQENETITKVKRSGGPALLLKTCWLCI